MRKASMLAALLAIAAVAGTLGGGAARATDATSIRTVRVDDVLVNQLATNPTGGATAIVTTYNRDDLAKVEAAGVRGTRLKVLPMIITGALTQAQLSTLRGMAEVRSVWGERRYHTTMEDTTWITKARYVWATTNGSGGPQGFGVTGKGVELAVIDTGIDGKHEDTDNLVEFCESNAGNVPADPFVGVHCTPWDSSFNLLPAGPCGAASPGSSNQGPAGPCQNKARGDATDDEGHGSHVSGTVAGTGHASGGMQANHSTTGMSPHAKLRVYSSNIGPSLLNWQTLAAYDDLIVKKEAGYNNVVAVNNSWGGGSGNYDPGDPTAVAVKRAWAAGILSVFAAGNDGPEHETLSTQCVDPYVACVAATTKPDSIVMFSSRGRPTQPTDTNRDGVIDEDDVQPDNHDWQLGQSLQKGRYRPTLAAPGVNINSISANSPGCREDDLIIPAPELPKSGCYEQLNGTSMATPHVTGAIGLIVQAYRQGNRGRTPTPNQLIDILERSANLSKLPAWEAEEQGAGRLDVYEAVRIARGLSNPRRPNFGHPTPPYVPGDYPKGAQNPPSFTGCTAAGSWSAQGTSSAPRYGQHFINVGPKTERLRVTVRWDELANHYVRLWRPGINPDADVNPPGPTRAFPDQESVGLLDPDSLPFLGPERLIEVRSPETGTWTMRVYNRVPDPTTNGCGATNETPPVAERTPGDGHDYEVFVELPHVTHQPSVVIDSPAANAQTTGRWVTVKGRAGYPPHAQDPPPIGNVGYSWEGVTQWEVPGTAGGVASEHGEPDPAHPRPVLYMHGNQTEGCSGQGEQDLLVCGGPFLLKKSPDGATAGTWRSGEEDIVFDGASDRTIYDPNWTWCLAPGPGCAAVGGDTPLPGPQTVEGPMTVEWWATCELICNIGADWMIRVWGDGQLKLEQRVSAAPTTVPPVPDRLKATVIVPAFTANQRITVHIDPVFIDTQAVTLIHYDGGTCPGTSAVCDSLVRMPVGGTGASPGGPAPQNLRVTDLPANAPYPAAPQVGTLRIAWDPVTGASSYRVERSTSPTGPWSVVGGTQTPCTSPEAPGNEPDAPPGHDRSGICLTNSGLSYLTTYYYRVLSVRSTGARSNPSEIAYGAPTRYDRQVKLKVDRLYGPQHWEYALVSPSPTPPDTTNGGTSWAFLWDTLELAPGPHDLFARSFTQGIGSQKAQRTLRDDGTNPPPPPPTGGCPDDDNGDRIDDARDGDHDDDGDDDDDDCEDDDDHEEDDDD